jgi:drug/metabolite transporter (DMT)-like permease
MAVGDSLFFRGLGYLGLTRALALSLLNPLLTTLTGILLYGESMTLPRLAGIGLVIGGLALIISGRGQDGPREGLAMRRGVPLVFLAAASWALSATIMKPALLQVPVLAGTALRIPMAGLVLWLTPWTRGTLAAIRDSAPAERWRLGAVCGLNAIGSGLFTVAIRSGGVAVGNALASTAPLFAIPLEVAILKQRPPARTIVGAVLTVSGIGCLGF